MVTIIRKGVKRIMMNWNKSKKTRIIAAAIVIVIVLAMVVSTLMSAFM